MEPEKTGKMKNFLYNPVRRAALAVPELQLGCHNLMIGLGD
jgi:hypothetical protein